MSKSKFLTTITTNPMFLKALVNEKNSIENQSTLKNACRWQHLLERLPICDVTRSMHNIVDSKLILSLTLVDQLLSEIRGEAQAFFSLSGGCCLYNLVGNELMYDLCPGYLSRNFSSNSIDMIKRLRCSCTQCSVY